MRELLQRAIELLSQARNWESAAEVMAQDDIDDWIHDAKEALERSEDETN